MPAGYSKTPLAKKLGFKPGLEAWIINEPADFRQLLEPLPEPIVFYEIPSEPCHYVHLFSKQFSELIDYFPRLKAALLPDGMLWISWPKKASKVATDLDENIVREVGLSNGLVDVKVCAIDEVWSGLKFVYRLEDRPG